MLLKSANRISVSTGSRRAFDLPVLSSRTLRGSMLVCLIFLQGVVCANPDKCEDIPSNIVVPDDAPYECHVFDVSDVRVEAVGASFITAESLETVEDNLPCDDYSGCIRLGPGFSVAEDASFSASIVPDVTEFGCGSGGNCHNW